MIVAEYLDQFHITGVDTVINAAYISKVLYTAFVTKFKINMSDDEYMLFQEYRERIYLFVEDLRERSTDFIKTVLSYLLEIDPYVHNNVIFTWCLPKTTTLSRVTYKKNYRENIQKYNGKLFTLVNSDFITNFCHQISSGNISVPIHCIDILWYHLDSSEIEINISGPMGFNYLEIEEDFNDTKQNGQTMSLIGAN